MHYTALLDDHQSHVRFFMDARNPMQESFLSAERVWYFVSTDQQTEEPAMYAWKEVGEHNGQGELLS